LTGGTTPDIDIHRGVSFLILPAEDYLENNTIYNFNYTISSNYWNLDSWGITLKYGNGTVIGEIGCKGVAPPATC
jgi:hypothetical protein